MITVYRKQESKIDKIRKTNPNYWALLLSRSEYTESEITKVLDEIELINEEWAQFQEYVYNNILTDEIGEMNSFDGYASDLHKEIDNEISKNNYVDAHFSENSHKNCFPVRKWENEISKLRKAIKRIEKLIEKVRF